MELVQAINRSKIALVVFSKSYAESKWCLNELTVIMHCHGSDGQMVVPIFYDVDPSDVRHQKGAFGEALEALAQKAYSGSGEKMEYVLSNWKTILTQAANLSRWHINNYWSEAEQVQQIVKDVWIKLDITLLSITDFPVGLESHVQEVIGIIENQSGRVCNVAIWGMGGLGKTTVAKAIYNQIQRRFQNHCFIENIREICEKDSRGCINLQEQLLSGILKINVKVHSTALGTIMIRRRLSRKMILVVLDDVNMFEQLKSLSINVNYWMGSGSVLIVTTRDARILHSLNVGYIHEMKGMNETEFLELFSWHAFREASPREDLGELSRNAVAYCGGLPLALEVLGSYLCERKKQEWECVLSKLERIPNEQVQEKLRLSYDGLEDMEKKIFLDICCFFIGKDRGYAIEILSGCGFYPEIGIAILVERSLLKVGKNNKLGMHDLPCGMGREIIRQSSPEEPEERSQLWAHEDVLQVLTEPTDLHQEIREEYGEDQSIINGIRASWQYAQVTENCTQFCLQLGEELELPYSPNSHQKNAHTYEPMSFPYIL